MIAYGSELWPLTNVEEVMCVLHPHFSHYGSRITWAEIFGFSEIDLGIPRTMGEWVIGLPEVIAGRVDTLPLLWVVSWT